MNQEELKVEPSAKLLNPNVSVAGPTYGKRHGQIIIYFWMIFLAYCMRVNLSVGIVAMNDPTASNNPNIQTYNWTDKSVVLSAFFWGYILPQISAGWLANTFGPKWFLVAAMGVCSLTGLSIPVVAASFGSKGVMACRALQGLSQGFFYPSVHNLLSKWVPVGERSRMGTFVYSGSKIGTVTSMLMSGLIASSQYGWPMVLYVFSGAGLVWCLLFSYYGSNSPSDHPTISLDEKMYIQESLGVDADKLKKSTPWLKIFTSLPVWAIILTQCGYNWGYWTLLTQIPNYMNKVLKFDMKLNSSLSALPYFVFWILSLILSVLSDYLLNKKLISIALSRKIFNTIGFVVPAISLIYLGKIGNGHTGTVIGLLIISVSGGGATMSGFLVNHLDIAPNHAAILMGIANGSSNIFGILAPLAVQLLISDETDINQWRTIFYLAAGINILAALIFIIFGSGKVQPWNQEEEDEVVKEDLILVRKLSQM